MGILLTGDAHASESLASATGSDTVVIADFVALRRMLADAPEHDLVVMGPDVDLDAAAEFAGAERVNRPSLGVILVRRRVDTATLREALRAGIRNVVGADDLTALSEACRESRELSRQVRGDSTEVVTSGSHLGHLVTVFSAKGGCGKTTVATNLAASLSRAGRRVCLVDLDLAFGDVAIALQLFPQRHIADAVAMSGGIDRSAAAALVTPHSENLDTILAPVEPGAGESVSAALVGELLQTLKTMYDVVVVDTPPAFTDNVLAAFDASDQFVLLTTLDIPALKNLKLTLEMLELLGYAKERWRIVLNRADSKVGLGLDEVEKTLRTPIAAKIPSSRAVPASINRGAPIVLDSPGHAVSNAIRKFASLLLEQSMPSLEAPSRTRRSLSLRRRPAPVAS